MNSIRFFVFVLFFIIILNYLINKDFKCLLLLFSLAIILNFSIYKNNLELSILFALLISFFVFSCNLLTVKENFNPTGVKETTLEKRERKRKERKEKSNKAGGKKGGISGVDLEEEDRKKKLDEMTGKNKEEKKELSVTEKKDLQKQLNELKMKKLDDVKKPK